MPKRKPLLIIFLVVVLCVAYVKWHNRAADPLLDKQQGFQVLMPKSLPSGQKITGQRINIWHQRDEEGIPTRKIESLSAELNLRKEDWVYAIREYRAFSDEGTKTRLTNYDATSVQPTCIQQTSLQRTTYRLCHWIDYGRISVFEVKFVKQQTYIWTTFPTTLQKPISAQELDEYVDSFSPVDAGHWEQLIDVI